MSQTEPNSMTSRDAWRLVLGVAGALAGVSVVVLLLVILVKAAYVQPQVAGALSDEQRYELLANTQAEDQRLLTTYGWMDQSKGVVRIPVEAAMHKLIAEGWNPPPATTAIPPATTDNSPSTTTQETVQP
jgi:hypothetical protein